MRKETVQRPHTRETFTKENVLDLGRMMAKHEMTINRDGRYQTCYVPPKNPLGLLECAYLLLVSDMEKVSGKRNETGWIELEPDSTVSES